MGATEQRPVVRLREGLVDEWTAGRLASASAVLVNDTFFDPIDEYRQVARRRFSDGRAKFV